MSNNLKESGKLLFASWNINLDEVSFEHLDHYIAVENFLTDNEEPPSDAENIEKVRGYLEAFHHLCEVKNWDNASQILLSPLEFLDDNHLSLQLDIWSYYQEEISLAEKLLQKHTFKNDIDCLVIIGDGYINLGQYDKAFEAYQNGLKLSRQINDCNGEITSLLCLGLVCHYQGKYKEAIRYYQKGLNKNIKLENLTTEHFYLKAKILGNLGMTYYNLDEYSKSVECNESSLVLFRQLGDRRGELLSLLGLGQSLSDDEERFQCAQQALDIAQEIGDRSSEAEALNLLAMLYRYACNYQQAIDFHQQQILIAREVGDLRQEGYAMGNLSVVYEQLEDYNQSINYAQKYLSISKKLGDRRGEGAALHYISVSLLENSYLLDALEILQTALKIFREVSSRSEEAEVLKDIAIVYWELDEINSAIEYCNKALSIAIELELPLVKECQDLKEKLLIQ